MKRAHSPAGVAAILEASPIRAIGGRKCERSWSLQRRSPVASHLVIYRSARCVGLMVRMARVLIAVVMVRRKRVVVKRQLLLENGSCKDELAVRDRLS